MIVIITGGGGFLGQTLAKSILSKGTLRTGDTHDEEVRKIILADICDKPSSFLFSSLNTTTGEDSKIEFKQGDVSSEEYCNSLFEGISENVAVFHLGAVMSGTGEQNFDLAMNVNLRGTMNLLECCRRFTESSPGLNLPGFLFTSAGATLGSGHPADYISKSDTISDASRATPHTTYGMTKACCELLMSDYSRRKFLDGRGVRLPTVIVRAGSPNAATTSCFSSVVREPLNGIDVTLPIAAGVKHAVTSYRAAIGGILKVHEAPLEKIEELLGFDRTVFLPSRAVSLGDLAQALNDVVKEESHNKLGTITYEVNEFLSDVVGSFPTKCNAERSIKLGCPETPDLKDIIREYAEDFPSDIVSGLELNEHSSEGSSLIETFESGKGVTCLITGAGSGIGRAVAVRLAQSGWGGHRGKGVFSGNGEEDTKCTVGLIFAGRREDPLKETEKLCMETAKEYGVSLHILVVPTDVTNEKEVLKLFSEIKMTFGRLDLLFNNAGVNMPPTSMENVPFEDWKRIIDVNLTGCYLCAKAAMQLMAGQNEPKGGRIINNGSISADRPRPGAAPYTVTKHGVLGLTKSIALDGRRLGVACGQIDFGNVTSALTAKMATGMPQADWSLKSEPTMSVKDAADAVFQMASLPPGANVLQMTIMATEMPFVGRG